VCGVLGAMAGNTHYIGFNDNGDHRRLGLIRPNLKQLESPPWSASTEECTKETYGTVHGIKESFGDASFPGRSPDLAICSIRPSNMMLLGHVDGKNGSGKFRTGSGHDISGFIGSFYRIWRVQKLQDVLQSQLGN